MNDQIKNGTPDNELVCAGCLNHLQDVDYISALEHEWHTECFRCSACDVALSSWYFEKDGLLFCQADYWSKYGESCQYCNEIITGPVMVAGEHRFHPECFCCSSCRAFIGDGEAYALIERSKLYCGTCYKHVMQPLGRGRAAHSIRVVEVPPRTTDCGNDGPKIRLAASSASGGPFTADFTCRGVTIKDMDLSYGLMALHIGDRILEINGTPIKDQPISEIEHLICYSDTVLQLTIEHDPEAAANHTSNIPQHLKNYGMMYNNNVHRNESRITKNDKTEARQAIETAIQSALVDEKKPTTINDTVPSTESCHKFHIPLDEGCENEKSYPRVDSSYDEIEKEQRGNGERLFKRREGAGRGGRALRRRLHPAQSNLCDKDRSSSMSRLLDAEPAHPQIDGVLCDLSRTRSFRVDAANPSRTPPRVFRAADLLQGELLGSGFFGQVYKVTHRDTNEIMVLKQLYRVDEDAQKNFLKEVAVLRSLSHTNVLRFIGVLYKDKRLHLVTEYVAGGTLRELLQDSSLSLAWSLRARLARDVAAGLAYLHRMNVIHRDLNSHNCLLREDKTVIVADFGLARIVQRTGATGSMERSRKSIENGHGSVQRKKRYTVVGNPYWMAPEMMKGNVYDEKVDVFSFGIVLCEIIGRVNADPDYLPRNSDFGLNEKLFIEKFCDQCPEPFYQMAFLCCNLNPDNRPPFEVLQEWLESLAIYLSVQDTSPPDLLRDILEYVGSPEDLVTCKRVSLPSTTLDPPNSKKLKTDNSCCTTTISKSNSGTVLNDATNVDNKEAPKDLYEPRWSYGLGPKCVSASHICQNERPVIKVTKLSRSQNVLSTNPSGYIVHTDEKCKTINITRVDDITKWLDPPKSPRAPNQSSNEKKKTIHNTDFQNKLGRVFENDRSVAFNKFDLPLFLRNQSVEELESNSKSLLNVAPQTFCRHTSIPDSYSDARCTTPDSKLSTDSEDTVLDEDSKRSPKTNTTRNPSKLKTTQVKGQQKNNKCNNLDQRATTPDKKLILKPLNNLARKLMSPKLGRLFGDGNNDTAINSSYKIRPAVSDIPIIHSMNKNSKIAAPAQKISLKSDVKNNESKREKCMTPIFRRHHMKSDDQMSPAGRFSYRDSRTSKSNSRWFTDGEQTSDVIPSKHCPGIIVPNHLMKCNTNKANDLKLIPISRCNNLKNIPSLSSVLNRKFPVIKISDIDKDNCEECDDDQLFRNDLKESDETCKKNFDLSISHSNYVSLANLRINCPSLGRTRESIVKRNIKKFDESLRAGTETDLPKTNKQLESTLL